MIIMPIYTQSTSHCTGNYAPSKMLCVASTLIDIVISGLFFGIAYFAYVVFKEQEYIPGFLLVMVDLLVLVLAIICLSETIDSYKELKDFAKEYKENKAIKERIARNKRLNSLESYDELERLPERQKRLYISKDINIDNYVNSLFRKEKQNERK